MRDRNRHGRARPIEVLVTAYTPPGGAPVARCTTHRQVDRLLEALRGQGCEVHGYWYLEHAQQGLLKYGLDFHRCTLLDKHLLYLA